MPTSWRPAPLSLPPARPAASRTCAPTARTCALPTAQIREPALTHRQMRASLSPAAAAIQPWMGGGRAPSSRRGLAEASPSHAVHHVHHAQAARLSNSSLKQPTRAQRASGRASLFGEQARRARSRRLPDPGRARGVASPQHPPSFWPPPPPRSSPAGGHAPFNIAPRRRWADRRPY